MELTIDGRACDLGAARCVVPGYDAARLADPAAAREGRSLRIELPATPRNDAATGFARDPHAFERFNDARHRAAVTAAGATLFAGTARLLAASDAGYAIEIRAGGAGWARQAAQRTLGALGIGWSARLDPATICGSWTDDSPVKFFPVLRDEYPQVNAPDDLLPAERILSTDDYLPFLHVETLVRRIFAEAGYGLRSRFMESELFRSLYMSGAYAARDTAALDARMGFAARRLGPATAAADDIGRVYADPKLLAHTVGNLVDTAAPGTLDADGEPMPGLRDNGGCFTAVDGKIRFVPTTEVSVGFEYRIRYTTDHRILDRNRLAGFDAVYLGPGAGVSCTLANRYEDRRAAVASGRSYRAVVFAHAAGAEYRLTCTRDGVAGRLWAEFAERTAAVATPAAGTTTDPVLEVRSGGAWVVYGGDWALYDGHVGERGRTVVELRVRTAAQRCSPASPARFDLIHFSGAEPGMTLTLHKECSVRSCFAAGPGYGAALSFADVARHGIRQSELLAALAHLFDLRFRTDEELRCVEVEPAAEFFDGPEADWRAKSDFAQPVVLSDIASEVHERRVWGYREGDGAVRRLDAEAGETSSGTGAAGPLGEWAFEVASCAAKEGTQRVRNPLFAPSASEEGGYRNAPSARILRVGDRDAATPEPLVPRIVRYAGMHPLPAGERWGAPWLGASYPLAAFHFAGDAAAEPFTLCFEDRDGAAGLHRFYDGRLAQEAACRRIALSLRIEPHEYEALFAAGTGAPGIRSVFRLDTGRGAVAATLEGIGGYDPEAASVRCLFTLLPGERP